ncbi:feruloyl-CoA synthetase 1 [Alcanivorax sp. S71-1-4]|uniref:long-chain-fatty-acid--CoA ligase n=1 Tax=Alcanivorax sp. S71-1-4 TaxID=1177159 RepID=UPI00135AE016|nr:long-chain-fatty-acid--CoA ligase [Alcanivorax sp. S71-1-4]KAF0807915.1 feruloyl-CoA synthetase 1 [Alcanivorax sp. S71-1-4]
MGNAHYRFWPKGQPKTLRVPATTLCRNLEDAAERYPERPAVIYYDGVLTYGRFAREVDVLAGYLQQHCGVARGDRVALFSQNCPQFFIAYYAVLALGAAVVPVNAMSTTPELQYFVEDSGARVALLGQEMYERARPLVDAGLLGHLVIHTYSDYIGQECEFAIPDWVMMPRREINDPAVVHWQEVMAARCHATPATFGPDQMSILPYTSGTTGQPKGCVHNHRTLMAAVYGSAIWRGLNAETVFLSVAPLFHLLGMQNGMNLPILLGATVVMLPRWDEAAAARLIEKYQVSFWSATPAMLVDFFSNPVLEKHDLSSLALLAGGGAAMPEAISLMLREKYGIYFNEAYGLTETAAFLHGNPVHRGKPQCLGVPAFGVDSRVVDPETLEELPQGEVGELITSGDQIMVGYWNNDDANREAFIERDGKRFFRTGDLAAVDEDGYYFMRDRLKRMISVSGYKVWPAEVENAMYDNPDIQEACIVSVPDRRSGEAVKAIVVLKPGRRSSVTEQDIIGWARQRMAVYKAPRQVEFRSSLPRSATGKILWRELQEEQARADHKTGS